MWKSVNGSLVHTTDISRVKFRTNISKTVLERLKNVADKNNTHVNYLMETGLEDVLSEGVITFNKELRPKDRTQYKTTYDKELLEKVKEFAKEHNLYINDVIEYSADFVNIENSKKRDHKHRTE
ncbi:rRNA methyltransferase [Pontibacillus yanchengensis]|uniref:rRNA methyltransferase n=1 Tax=Pontibacillus yanchengensis TaxID=462910 RepID=A0A6I5A384_9BACI|nr:rRNA methyltransferase [Pontibacillus yanchengensis]MYL32939.1 rRNA methyltransferase [Pontibacillus yanchengensis]